MDKFVDILENLTSNEEFHNPLDYDDKKKDEAKAIDELVNTGLMAMVIFVITKNLSIEQRCDCVAMLKTRMRSKYIKEYEKFSKEEKVKDILSQHREDIVIEINRKIDAACRRLRDLLQVA